MRKWKQTLDSKHGEVDIWTYYCSRLTFSFFNLVNTLCKVQFLNFNLYGKRNVRKISIKKIYELLWTTPCSYPVVREAKVWSSLVTLEGTSAMIKTDNKVRRFQTSCGSVRRIPSDKIRRETKVKSYKVTLLYGSEVWTTTKEQK